MSIKNPINEKLDIFILAGQSNMEGNGKGGESTWQKNPRILMMSGEISTRVEKYLVVDVADEYYIDIADERTSSEGEKCGILALPFAELYAGELLDSDRKILLILLTRQFTVPLIGCQNFRFIAQIKPYTVPAFINLYRIITM